jgi:hypothetical protein
MSNDNMQNQPHSVTNLELMLQHWCDLSNVERRALIALAKEVDTASHLIENSISDLSEHFLHLAGLAQHQSSQVSGFVENLSDQLETAENKLNEIHTTLISGKEISETDLKDAIELVRRTNVRKEEETCSLLAKEVAETLKTSDKISDGISDIVTKIQFQDRTSQRLGHISATLRVVVDMMKEMEAETNPLGTQPEEAPHDNRWMMKMIADMHLGEMRERFLKHALFDTCDTLFDAATVAEQKADHAESSEDIELF